jgi:hypothetical protein
MGNGHLGRVVHELMDMVLLAIGYCCHATVSSLPI